MNQNNNEKCRWWFGTLNNPVETLQALAILLHATYFVGQEELADSGTRHFQFCFWLKNAIRFSTLKKSVPTAHFEICRDPQKAIAYCSKKETRVGETYTLGTPPFKRNDSEDWEKVRALAKVGDFDSIDPQIAVTHFTNLLRIHSHYSKPVPVAEVRGFWIYGKPGVGKSFYARQRFPNSYSKAPQNKWWDGYRGEDSVIIDDLDRSHSFMGGYLKNWLDVYACQVEIKGGSMPLSARFVCITSNYHPSEIWDDQILFEAITRRLQLVLFMRPDRSIINHEDL